jgi:spermidine/putrescine-binding protein
LTACIGVLAACGGSDEKSRSAAAGREEPVLYVYNWADYVAGSTIRDFEIRTGIKVVYDVYDSNEVLQTKLLVGHSGYDVVVPGGGLTYRLVQAGILKKLQKSKFKNYGNLDPAIMRFVSVNDPGNEHAIPYLRGTTGIGYNPDQVARVLSTRSIDSLAAIFDPAIASKLASCGITWLDAPADMFSLALIYLGLDANSERPEDRVAAEEVLTRVRPYVRYFHSSQYVNDLASGEVCVSVGWSGPIQQARIRGAEAETPVNVAYIIPKEGAPLWCDMVGIPIDAPHPENAYAFIDYLMEAKVIADVTNTVGQANGNAAALPYVTETIRNDPSIYMSDEVLGRLTIDRSLSDEHMRQLWRAWTRIRARE